MNPSVNCQKLSPNSLELQTSQDIDIYPGIVCFIVVSAVDPNRVTELTQQKHKDI